MVQKKEKQNSDRSQALLDKLMKKAKVPTLPLVAQKLVELYSASTR